MSIQMLKNKKLQEYICFSSQLQLNIYEFSRTVFYSVAYLPALFTVLSAHIKKNFNFLTVISETKERSCGFFM